MSPFLQLRLWWLRANSGDRVAATLVAAVVIALVAWALVPTTSDDESASEGPRALSGAAGQRETGDATTGGRSHHIGNLGYGEVGRSPTMRQSLWLDRPTLPRYGKATVGWWEAVSTLPHCILWTPGDWQFALATARVHAAFSRKGGERLAGEPLAGLKNQLTQGDPMTKTKRIPKVRLARPAGRPLQLRYTDPETGKEVRISAETYDEAEALKQLDKLKAKLTLGIEVKRRPVVRPVLPDQAPRGAGPGPGRGGRPVGGRRRPGPAVRRHRQADLRPPGAQREPASVADGSRLRRRAAGGHRHRRQVRGAQG